MSEGIVLSSLHLLAWIHQYGYIGLAGLLVLGIVGLPLPDETLLTAVGYLIYRGDLQYVPSLVAGVVGGSIGITISYVVGYRVGRPLILWAGRYLHLTEKRFARVERYFERYGALTLLLGFFVPGVRHVTAIVAGVGAMPYSRFALAAYTGVCIWVTLFITLGRFAGPQILALRALFPASDLWLALIMGAALCLVFLTWLWAWLAHRSS